MAGARLIVADDHPLYRAALRQTLALAVAEAEIVEAGSFEDVLGLLEASEGIDLVLFDLKMPGVQGLSGLVYMRSQYPGVPVAVVSASEEPALIRRALDLGASGFIPKSTPVDEMKIAVKALLGGEMWWPPGLDRDGACEVEPADLARRLTTLTPQQVRVLMLLREGLLNKQIAYHLGVTEATIKAHVSAILQKLDVESRTQAVIAASRIDGDATAWMPS